MNSYNTTAGDSANSGYHVASCSQQPFTLFPRYRDLTFVSPRKPPEPAEWVNRHATSHALCEPLQLTSSPSPCDSLGASNQSPPPPTISKDLPEADLEGFAPGTAEYIEEWRQLTSEVDFASIISDETKNTTGRRSMVRERGEELSAKPFRLFQGRFRRVMRLAVERAEDNVVKDHSRERDKKGKNVDRAQPCVEALTLDTDPSAATSCGNIIDPFAKYGESVEYQGYYDPEFKLPVPTEKKKKKWFETNAVPRSNA